MKILANDGISQAGIKALENQGAEVITTNIAQEQLANYMNKHEIDVLLVRSATQVRKDLINAVPSLKLIGRAGVGMDNIDTDYAKSKGIHVINTPAASSQSVAELVFAHLFGMVRFLHDSNRKMPLEGDSNFKSLKKNYAKGKELRGKTLGIIGFGRIGTEVAKIALGIGMNVIVSNINKSKTLVTLTFYNGQTIDIEVKQESTETLLKTADFITLHVPAQSKPLIGQKEFELMKNGVGIVNASRGGVIDEVALVNFIKSGKVAFAGLDTFENEPKPEIALLMNGNLSLTPHIGAATIEAQDRIGVELATQIKNLLG